MTEKTICKLAVCKDYETKFTSILLLILWPYFKTVIISLRLLRPADITQESTGHVGQWASCEKVNGIYISGLLVAASVLFTGNQFEKYYLQCDIINLANISETTYNDCQA